MLTRTKTLMFPQIERAVCMHYSHLKV